MPRVDDISLTLVQSYLENEHKYKKGGLWSTRKEEEDLIIMIISLVICLVDEH